MTAYVLPGDTLIRLAIRHLGDASRWREIADLNSLDAPYITDDAAPFRARGLTVLQPTDAVLIPNPRAGNARTVSEAEDAVYGIDLGWDQDARDLIRVNNHLQYDRGVLNLAKALWRRIMTRPGQLPAHPTYGCFVHERVGGGATPWSAYLASLDIKRTLLADARILDATVTAEFREDGGLWASALVTPIPPVETFTLTLPLESI